MVDIRPNSVQVIQSSDVFVDREAQNVSDRHQCRPLHSAIPRELTKHGGKIRRLHMWTIDTYFARHRARRRQAADFDAVELRRTDFKRCFDTGMSNAQVLDLIKKSGIPVGVLGVEYGWLFATGSSSAAKSSIRKQPILLCSLASNCTCASFKLITNNFS